MKNLLTLLFSIAVLYACQPGGYKIEGEIAGAQDGHVYLKSLKDGRPFQVDSALITNGQFELTGSIEHAELYLIFVNEAPAPVAFFLENKNIKIKADIARMDTALITGSPETELFLSFNKDMPHATRSQEIRSEFMQAQMTNDTAAMKNLQQEMTSIMEEQKKFFEDFVHTNTQSAVGAFLATNMAGTLDLEALRELIAKYEEGLGEHPYINEMKKTLEPLVKYEQATQATAEGSVAPDFTLPTKDGEEIKLASFQGKYVLVDFWASWCGPCRQENPNVVKAYNQFKDKGFEVLSVSVDQKREDWIKAVEDDGLTWTQVIDAEGNVAQTYGVQSIPSTFLLDKEGKIIAKNLRGNALTDKLNELLN